MQMLLPNLTFEIQRADLPFLLLSSWSCHHMKMEFWSTLDLRSKGSELPQPFRENGFLQFQTRLQRRSHRQLSFWQTMPLIQDNPFFFHEYFQVNEQARWGMEHFPWLHYALDTSSTASHPSSTPRARSRNIKQIWVHNKTRRSANTNKKLNLTKGTRALWEFPTYVPDTWSTSGFVGTTPFPLFPFLGLLGEAKEEH